jgi:drug/metabolite transporter (DMT)-like permease
MKSKIWKIIVLAVFVTSIGSFLFVFEENKIDPRLGGIPFVFWTALLVAVLLVVLTFLGSRFFPHDDSGKA